MGLLSSHTPLVPQAISYSLSQSAALLMTSVFGGAQSCSGGISAVRNAVRMSTEHHVMSGPQNADNIHRSKGPSKPFVAVDSFCSQGSRFPHIASLDLYFIHRPSTLASQSQ
eukprot:2111657-Amphidinium_carterae.1